MGHFVTSLGFYTVLSSFSSSKSSIVQPNAFAIKYPVFSGNADKIKMIAKSKNISIKKLLEDVGLGFNTMSNMKTSMPKADNLAKIADYLNVTTDYLLGRTNENTKIKGSTIVAGNIKDTNIESDIIEDTSIMGINIENTKIGNSYRKNNTEQAINENEAELLKVYRSLSFRDKHELMSILYKMEDEATKAKNC